MKRDHDGNIAGFYCTHEAYYAEHLGSKPEIMIGFFDPEGGTSGEFAVRWVNVSGKRPTPQLQVFDDGWSALANMPQLVKALGERDNEDMTPEQVKELLLSIGLTDLTKRMQS